MAYKKITKIIETLIIAVLTVLALLVGVSMLPLENNYKLLIVNSGSMEPNINIGSVVAIVPSENYKVGEIVTFPDPQQSNPKKTVTHRIFSINSDESGNKYFATKGDANDGVDNKLIAESEVIGKYIFDIPYLGYILGYIKTLPGLVLIIIIPATLIIYEEIKKLKKEADKIVKKKSESKKSDIRDDSKNSSYTCNNNLKNKNLSIVGKKRSNKIAVKKGAK